MNINHIKGSLHWHFSCTNIFIWFLFTDFTRFIFFETPFVFESDQSIIEIFLIVGVLLMLYAKVLKITTKK